VQICIASNQKSQREYSTFHKRCNKAMKWVRLIRLKHHINNSKQSKSCAKEFDFIGNLFSSFFWSFFVCCSHLDWSYILSERYFKMRRKNTITYNWRIQGCNGIVLGLHNCRITRNNLYIKWEYGYFALCLGDDPSELRV
jgi:hypothetical protein